MAAVTLGRTREATAAGRLPVVVRTVALGVLRWGRRVRSLVLRAAGLGMVTGAAWQVATALGLLVGGVALLRLEWLTNLET